MIDPTARRKELEVLASHLAIEVKDSALFDRAMTHASACAEEDGPHNHYESLEFVGDAALGLAVTHYLYERAPGRTPGEYSHMRAQVVNRRALTRVAERLDIAGAIRLGKGEERSGGRRRKALLADCMEAIIGALFLDQGFASVQGFVERVFVEELDDATSQKTVWDYKSRLQIYCQSRHEPLPKFEVVRSEGPDHRKEFEVAVRLGGRTLGQGVGSTKKEAEQNAAHEALKKEGQLKR